MIHRPVAFAVFLAGIGFAVILMFVQLGFWGALLDSFTALIDRMNADLVIINKAKHSLVYTEPFPRSWLIKARAVPGVADTRPLYIRVGVWKNPGAPNKSGTYPRLLIRVIAYDLSSNALSFPEVKADLSRLRMPETALGDSSSKRNYRLARPPLQAELNGRKIEVVGLFDLGTDFVNDANLLMTEQNFVKYFGTQPLERSPLEDVDVGMVFLSPGANLQKVKQELSLSLPTEVQILTRAELAAKERRYWQTSMPVGFVFLLGLIVGFLVGVVICSQILSSDVADHLAEYATLKAIGYSNGYLSRVIIVEALLLSVLAFIPGTLVSLVIYRVLSLLTGLPLQLTLMRGCVVLGFTMLMCVVSGIVASRKVRVADPAEVF